MFDGVHLGHRAVVEAAVLSARHVNGLAAALTFDPHPSRLLRPDAAVPLLLPPDTKAKRLLVAGLDAVIIQAFTREFAAVDADDFVPMLKRALPHLRTIFVGENWRFGKGRKGDVDLLNAQAKAHGVRIFSAPRVNLDGDPISSTRIRAALQEGNLDLVNALLGYTYTIDGVVKAGQSLGRRLGFPTLNVPWAPECAPCLGVYAVQLRAAGVKAADGKERVWRGVANYGLRPTVAKPGESLPRLEVHLFDTPPFGEGTPLEVEWCGFLRREKRFAGVDALRAQIGRDVTKAREYFGAAET
ncbi:MAG: riboflavin biosynthesis protein RibF [Candidatus Synoicihabitans palmerolidicus]|nr:riboflavin biosynthesis protein RibF [Candidatus Synoicihabitans palmerolidicus]